MLKCCAAVLLLAAATLSYSQEDHAADRAYIRQSESDWAEQSVTHDVAVLERILADDFVGVSTTGKRYTKAEEIKTSQGPIEFLSNHLDDVNIRFFGDTAIAQGSESWKKKNGSSGKFVWTDTWLKRNGKWQIVAATDVLVLDPTPGTK